MTRIRNYDIAAHYYPASHCIAKRRLAVVVSEYPLLTRLGSDIQSKQFEACLITYFQYRTGHRMLVHDL